MPLLPPGCTVVTDTINSHIKRPNLMSFETGTDLNKFILQEAEVGETLRSHSHPNLAKYYEYTTSAERISGLCFKKISKASWTKSIRTTSEKPLSSYRGRIRKPGPMRLAICLVHMHIEQGIRHLHSLGRIHNGLNPSNIMITEDDVPVIIDFDTASLPGRPGCWKSESLVANRASCWRCAQRQGAGPRGEGDA